MSWLKIFLNLERIFILKEHDYLIMKFSEDDTSLIGLEQATQGIKERFPKIADRIIFVWGNIEIYVVHKSGAENK